MTVVELAPDTVEWAPPTSSPIGLDATPLPRRHHLGRRALRHRRAMHYHRLIGGFVGVNLAIALYALFLGRWFDGSHLRLRHVAAIAQANFVLASLPRQQWMVNLVGWIATRPGHQLPLRMRWALGKYYHLGGMHVGAAVSGTLWYAMFVISLAGAYIAGGHGVTFANVLVSWAVVALFLVMVVLALPAQRSKHHDRFEISHRFCAWGALALVWLNTVLFVDGQRSAGTLLGAMAGSPTVWLLALTTACAVWPWLLLRRVPITVEKPSGHCAAVTVHHDTTPPIGTTRPISRHPLVGWHHFACVPAAPGESGYRMVVSRAGDWTGEFIDDPPSHVWVRGIPAVGVANVRRLFRRVVFVATGSGIGPALGHLLASGPDCKLVWVTRNPVRTYGEGLVGEVMRAQPDAVIWDTDALGKPDVLRLAYGAFIDFDAEAVICVSNKDVTWQVVEGLEQRGVPAFGPIWDS